VERAGSCLAYFVECLNIGKESGFTLSALIRSYANESSIDGKDVVY